MRFERVAFGATAERLYAHENEATPSNLIRLAVTETNLQVLSSQRNLISAFDAQIHYSVGRLYASTGRVIDPETLTLLGEIPGGHEDALILPLPAAGRHETD